MSASFRWIFTLAAILLVSLQALTSCSPGATSQATGGRSTSQSSAATATAEPASTATPRPATTAVSTVYAQSDHALVALDAHTGALRWQYPSGATVLAVADGMLYVGVADTAGADTLLALSANTGTVRWRLPFPRGAAPRMVAAQGSNVYIIRGDVVNGWLQDEALYALAATDGHVLWRHSMGLITISHPIMGPGVVYILHDDPIDEQSFIPGFNVTIYAIDARTGLERWRSHISKTEIAEVAASEQALYLLAEAIDAGSVYALDPADGHLLYHTFTAILGWSLAQLSLANGTLYNCRDIPQGQFGTPPAHSVITALDAANGQKRWQQSMNGVCLRALTATAGSTILLMRASDFDGAFTLHILDARTGVELRQYALPFAAPASDYTVPAIRISETTVYIEGIDLTVRAFNLDSGATIWQYHMNGSSLGDLTIA